MNKKIIQLRGGNSAGKTTIMKQVIKKYNLEEKEIFINNKKYIINISNDNKKIILGKYSCKNGGCDLFNNKEEIFLAVKYCINEYNPTYILLEGFIYSKTISFAIALRNFSKKFGYDFLAITLYRNPANALKLLYERNGNKKINEENFVKSHDAVFRTYQKLSTMNVNCKIYDVDKIKFEEMENIVEENW